ncbi:GNAT family N-acetyltransferase [Marinilactibacillus sp. GCM10026970]|uniref:GNAT family N-acetyltransferase n=1 Tax=Marinilactibacillus sp. GCM10026970 TaxID=3252642 RepID=UPI00360BEEF8
MEKLTIDQLILKQFAIDLNCTLEELEGFEHIFKTSPPSETSRYWARNDGDLIFYKDRIFCRTGNQALTQKLQETYKNRAGEWFGEIDSLIELNELLKPFKYKLNHYSPFFVPKHWTLPEVELSNLKIYEETEIVSFKEDERFEESFLYDKTDPDKLGIAHVIDDEIVAMIGANHNGKYTWEIGVEIVEDHHSKGIATNLVKAMTREIIIRNKQAVLPVYSTQFTHTKSINLAIRSGFKLGWTELVLTKIED